MPLHEKTLSSRIRFQGRIVRLETQEVELENGRTAYREIVRHPGAVCVLLRAPDGRFVLVRQFRKPVERILLEVVAGLRDGDEDPEACARREVKEETGYDVARLQRLGLIHPTPGYVDEAITCYYAEAVGERGEHDFDEDERLEVVALAEAELAGRIRAGDVSDGKTLAAWALFNAARGRDGKG
jgi:ADP-ribose pyrophosphatase